MINFYQKEERLKKDRRYAVSIDPSINSLGFAIWPVKKWSSLVMPLAYGDVTTAPFEEWTDKLGDSCSTLYSVLTGFGTGKPRCGCTRMYVEEPTYLPGNKGKMTAEKGDLVKLTASFGMLSGLAFFINAQFIPISIPKWKGQLSKQLVAERIRKMLPELKPNLSSHTYDAIGIGLYSKGLF